MEMKHKKRAAMRAAIIDMCACGMMNPDELDEFNKMCQIYAATYDGFADDKETAAGLRQMAESFA